MRFSIIFSFYHSWVNFFYFFVYMENWSKRKLSDLFNVEATSLQLVFFLFSLRKVFPKIYIYENNIKLENVKIFANAYNQFLLEPDVKKFNSESEIYIKSKVCSRDFSFESLIAALFFFFILILYIPWWFYIKIFLLTKWKSGTVFGWK